MDDVWCSLDMAGIHSALAYPFSQPFTDSAVSSIGNGVAYFGVDDVDLMVEVDGMADMDATGLFGGGDARFVLPSSTSSSLSSKRSLSIDSGGSSGSFTLDHAAALPSQQQAPPPPPPVAHEPFNHDDEAIMRAMMAVMSSSSPSPSSSAPSGAQPFSRDSSMAQQAAAVSPQLRGVGDGHHVMVKSSLAMSPERTSSGSRGQQPDDPRAASGNSGQLYHMMSERKRREKLNDKFQELRSLLPPCSKKDKTTVLIKAAGYLKILETHVSVLEEKNSKLEKHIPACEEDDAIGIPRWQRAKIHISKALADEEVVNLTVMVMVECDVVELVLRILECLRWMEQISVLSVEANTYSSQVLLKAIANIKLRVVDDDWNEAYFHEEIAKAVNDATSSPPPPPPHALIVLTT